MTPNNKDRENDDDIEGLQEVSELYKNEKQSLTTPEHLEFMVKRMARDQARQSKPAGASGGNRKFNWMLSAAAAVVIAVAVVLTVQVNNQPTVTDIAQQQPDPQQSVPQQTEPAESFDLADPLPDLHEEQPTQHADSESAVQQAEQPVQQVVETQQEPMQSPDQEVAVNTEPGFQFNTPEDVNDLNQPTGTRQSSFPDDATLKTWSEKQWRDAVLISKQKGDMDLEKRYLDSYRRIYGKDLRF